MRGKKIHSDRVFILLLFNMLLVLLTYSYNSITHQISSGATLLKQIILGFSLMHILLLKSSRNRLKTEAILLPICIVFLSVLNINFQQTFFKTVTFILPYIYIYFAVNYLISKYAYQDALNNLITGINLIYLYPVLTYFIFDSGFKSTSIYGYREDFLFVGNHYGWASSIFITSLPIALSTLRKKRFISFILLSCIILSIYLVIISGNRSSLFSLFISLIFLIFKTDKSKLSSNFKLLIIPVILIFFSYFYLALKDEKGSSINLIKERSERQFGSGKVKEARVLISTYTVEKFNNDPILWITGVGLFNYSLIQGVSNLSAYHNSYLEILFGCGVPVFIIFLSIMVFRPLKLLYYDLGGNYILIIPLIIIPYFESNITGGQFLFFPWFILMLLLNAKSINPRTPDSTPKTAVIVS
jgi:hypothetical protein